MKKTLLIVFGSIAAAGLALGIIGFALGGWFGSVVFSSGRMYYAEHGRQVALADAPAWMRHWNGTWQLFGWNDAWPEDWEGAAQDEAVIAEPGEFTAAPFAAGDDVKVDIEIDAGYLTIQEGDEWGLEVRGPLAATARVEDGVWKIESKANLDNIRTSSQDWNARPRFYRGGEDVTTDYILTLPRDVGALDAELGMGVVSASGLAMQKADFTLSLGLMKVKDSTAEKADFHVDLGAAEVKDFTAVNCELSADLGSIEYTGDVTGTLEADCELGAINCTLKRPASYGYDLEVGLGAITIDGNSGVVTGQGSVKSPGGDERPLYKLKCDLGAIDIAFE